MERIWEAEAGFRISTEAIDKTTAPGRMMMQMVGVFAEFERAILRERTMAELDAARKRDRIGGRRRWNRSQQAPHALGSRGRHCSVSIALTPRIHGFGAGSSGPHAQ